MISLGYAFSCRGFGLLRLACQTAVGPDPKIINFSKRQTCASYDEGSGSG